MMTKRMMTLIAVVVAVRGGEWGRDGYWLSVGGDEVLSKNV